MKRLVLNSAVIVLPGVYRYDLVSVDEAIEWLKAGAYFSTIRYRDTAEALSSSPALTSP